LIINTKNKSIMKIAVIGSGIAGLSCAYKLAQSGLAVTLFEANDYFGGHTHTVDVTLEGKTHGVDTGFLVFNHKTYPNLVRLFEDLDIATVGTDMSFSVKMPRRGPGLFGSTMLEWAGANLNTVFAQRSNLLRPSFWRMLRDVMRFNRQATALAEANDDIAMAQPLRSFLDANRYSAEFRNWYLLPMAGCIWSCPTHQMLEFPVGTFIRFCHNHGLLQVNDRPQWFTVKGGARQYVEKMLTAIPDIRLNTPVKAVTRTRLGKTRIVGVETSDKTEIFDHVVMACHSDQTRLLLLDLDDSESRILSAIRYHPNRAVLHTDASLLPENKAAWSAWNYQAVQAREPQVCVHYLINMLQPLPFETPVIVSLNPVQEPAADKVIASYDYAHPVFDGAAVEAQKQLALLQGERNTWFAGAWTGYGFHEDGLKSGLAVAQEIRSLAFHAVPKAHQLPNTPNNPSNINR
jgi:predicted NAD/FAD-binding protein